MNPFFLNSEGTAIYLYETYFDTYKYLGKLKGKPVGVEYLGTDHKSVILSFPLYYMNLDQAKALLENILINKFDEATYLEDENNKTIPSRLPVVQNYPNPFNPSTNIRYEVNSAEFVSLKVYDVLGNKVATLIHEEMAPGSYDITFDASRLSSGIYFYTLHAGSFVQTKKMILIK